MWSATTRAAPDKVKPGNAPVRGTGSHQVIGPTRVIDGSTIEAFIDGQRVGIGIIGVRAPQANTPCGRQAVQFLQTLLSRGLRLDEDLAITFDSKKRRMYYIVNPTGRSVAKELVKAGLASPDGRGRESRELNDFAAQARLARAGCLHAPGGLTDPRSAEEDASPKSAIFKFDPRAALKADFAPSLAPSPTDVGLPSGFMVDVMTAGLTLPTATTFLPDGRILLTEKHGTVRVFKNGALLPAPLIDIRSKVNDYWDRGLLGIAADPNFATNGYVYLLYTYENNALEYDLGKTGRLSRFTVSGDTASIASEAIILGSTVGSTCNAFASGTDCIPSESPSHSVGNLKFDSAGNLLVTTGDAAPFNIVDDDSLRTQNLDLLSGKLLRITPLGAGLPTNPNYNGNPAANRSKVWAYGFRNPFRFNLRPGSGDPVPYVGDVGWSTWEEINVAFRGANLGWPCYEGAAIQIGFQDKPVCQSLISQQPPNLRAPLIPYHHNLESAAAVGGAFQSGATYPAEYQGAYFFGDYATSLLKYAKVDAANNLLSGPESFGYNVGGPVAIDLGPDQNLYYVAINPGELRRIRYAGSGETNPPQVSSFTPPFDSVGQSASTQPTATFSEAIDIATLTATTFTVVKQGTSTPIPATVTYDSVTKVATVRPNSPLQNGSQYTVTVVGGQSGVRDLYGNRLPENKSWIFTVLGTPPPGASYLSDLTWSFMNNGWGPVEKDRSNGEQAQGDGRVLTINGTQFLKGLGGHAPSEVRYPLGGSCTTLSGIVGIDDEVLPYGSVSFQIKADGATLYDSGVIFAGFPSKAFNVNLAGKNELALIITDAADNGASSDHGDWANVIIDCSGGQTVPAVTSVSPQQGAMEISLGTSVTATFSKTMSLATINSTTFTLTKHGSSNPLTANVVYNATNRTATLTPAANLESATTYDASVKGGPNGVKDSINVPMSQNYDWSFTTSTVAPGGTSYLSDVVWTSMTNGWGPIEKDRSNGEQSVGDGQTIKIAGVTHAKGLGAHAPAEVIYNLGQNCSLFQASAGIDDEVFFNGSVRFEVWADGTRLSESPLMVRGMPAHNFNVDITGRSELMLNITDGGDGSGNDHADWAGARVSCGTGGNTPPLPSISTPVSTYKFTVGDTISFSGTATDAQDGNIPASGLSWQVVIQHCAATTCHSHPLTTATGSGGSFVVKDHGDDFYFELILTAQDSGGLISTIKRQIVPKMVDLTLTSTPAGRLVKYATEEIVTPFTRAAIAGSAQIISIDSPQNGFSFVSWSDGGAIEHEINVGTTNKTLTAIFSDAPVIKNVTAGPISTTGATIAWVTDEASDTQVEYGTTGAYGLSTTINPSTVTSHTQALTGLTPTTLYHYRVKSRDAAGNLTVSGDFTFTTVPDTTGPAISGVTATSISATSATVTWTTNEASDTQVEYGTTAAYGTSTTLDPADVTSHAQVLSNLSGSTLYHYRVKSKDASGNLTVSGDFTFTTLADTTGPAISAVATSSITSTGATITWNTSEPADTQVEYGTTTDYGSSTTVNPNLVTSHSQALTGLSGSTLYHFRVKSKDASGNPTVSGDFTLHTVTDSVPPVIGGVAASSISATGAIITWTTDESSDSQVEYGQTVAYGSTTTLNTARVTTHSGSLTGLSAGTSYHYRVRSKDAGGNLSVSGDFTFTTEGDTTPPISSAVAAGSISATGAIITWTTDEPSDSQVEYGTTAAYGSSTTLNPAAVTSHSQSLTGLSAGTLYHYRVKSKDAAGNLANSGDFTFTTLGDTTPPVISAVASNSISGTSATITWTTNELSDTQVEYGTTTSYGSSTTLNPAALTAHSQSLTGLSAGTLYHYRVKSKDAAGNLAVSSDSTFTTVGDTTPLVISAVAASSISGTSATITWSTNEASDTQVEYGTTTSYGSSTTLNSTAVTTHSQSLTGLSAGTLYHYRVKSKDSEGNLAVSGDFTFTTTTPSDTTAPVISAVAASSVSASGATVTWTTNEPSDTQVEYGTTTSYGSSTTLAPATVTSHSQALTALGPATSYHYRVKSKDAAGNLAVSGDFTFMTSTSTSQLTVTALAPANNATGVASSTTVTATFSLTMDATTINTANFSLLKNGAATPITATVAYNSSAQRATLTPSGALEAGSRYTARVKSGTSGVKSSTGALLASDFVWSFVTLGTPPSGTTYLSTLPFATTPTNGWGPVERDKSNGEQAAGDGRTITLNGQTYVRGLGVHSVSDVRFNLGTVCTSFQADIGIDDEVTTGSVVFEVWTDGVKVFNSSTMSESSVRVPVTVNLTNKNQLWLRVTNGGDNANNDHADWANARVTCQ